jgi:general secretion pathway protein G
MNQKSKNKNYGFTMIELLVVIVIIGILSAIGLRSFSASQLKSRDSNRKSSLDGIATALELYYNDHQSYPLDDTGGVGINLGLIAGCGVGGVELCTYGSIWQDDNNTVYMVQLSQDPLGNEFFYVSDGTSYRLYARLENVNDGDVPEFNGAPGVYSEVSSGCGGDGCNYGITSSNTVLGSTQTD